KTWVPTLSHQEPASFGSLEITQRSATEQIGQKIDYSADRKSTRLNSSHVKISYAVFCLKKKNNNVNSRRAQDESMRNVMQSAVLPYISAESSLFRRTLTHLVFFFFYDTATTGIYTLSLHDALPIWKTWVPTLSHQEPASFGSLEITQRSATEQIGQKIDYS